MAEFFQRGETLDYTNAGSAKIEAGDVIVLGTKIGVAGCDIAVGAVGSVLCTGMQRMKTSPPHPQATLSRAMLPQLQHPQTPQSSLRSTHDPDGKAPGAVRITAV